MKPVVLHDSRFFVVALDNGRYLMRLFSLFGKLVLGLVIALIPLIGHIIATWIIVREPRLRLQKILWLVVVWIIPFFGPGLYLLVGRWLCGPFRNSRWGWMVPASLLLAFVCLLVAFGNG
jgi:hypothetical protein